MIMAKEQTQTPVEQLLAENAALKAQIAELEAKCVECQKQRTADDEIILAKMSRGLSREQALQVIARQREYDAAKKASVKTKTK
jgi:hypothetical protein